MIDSDPKSSKPKKRPRLGDIIEIPLREKKGFAYAQFVYNHREPPQWGSLVRILPGIYDKRLSDDDLAQLVQGEELFVTFLTLGTIINQHIFTIAGHAPVPNRFEQLPLFKAAGARDQERGRVKYWYTWDGTNDRRVYQMTTRIRNLPILELVNPALLIERIEKGWMPADEVD